MALTAGDEAGRVVDNWDDSKHTVLENAMVHFLKFLLSRAMVSDVEYDEIARMFPILWGN